VDKSRVEIFKIWPKSLNKHLLPVQLFSSSPPVFGGLPRISGKRHTKWATTRPHIQVQAPHHPKRNPPGVGVSCNQPIWPSRLTKKLKEPRRMMITYLVYTRCRRARHATWGGRRLAGLVTTQGGVAVHRDRPIVLL
jgi:hypothetical protein